MTTATHGVLNHTAVKCRCGSLLYEDNQRREYCLASNELVRVPEPRHMASCGFELETGWQCAPGCAVKALQGGLL